MWITTQKPGLRFEQRGLKKAKERETTAGSRGVVQFSGADAAEDVTAVTAVDRFVELLPGMAAKTGNVSAVRTAYVCVCVWEAVTALA